MSQCNNQEFEMKEDNYPPLSVDEFTGTDIGGYSNEERHGVYLTNNYNATTEYNSEGLYFQRMVYKITPTTDKCKNYIYICIYIDI